MSAADNSVNAWIIALPLTGIILVMIFTIMCICRYTCRCISYCTKICEKNLKGNTDNSIKIPLPSHTHINEVLESLSPKIEHRGLPVGATKSKELAQCTHSREAVNSNTATEGEQLLNVDNAGYNVSPTASLPTDCVVMAVPKPEDTCITNHTTMSTDSISSKAGQE